MTRKHFLLALVAVAVVQTAALGSIVIGRDRLLKNGREITMKVVPVDPRDIFRGDYVILGYDVNQIAAENGVDVPPELARGGVVYTQIAPRDDDTWRVVSVTSGYPSQVGAGNAVLKGRVLHIHDRAPAAAEGTATQSLAPPVKVLTVRYGIESYFVPEGEGKALETEVRDRAVKTVLAVGPDGTAAIKALIAGGKRVDTPAIF